MKGIMMVENFHILTLFLLKQLLFRFTLLYMLDKAYSLHFPDESRHAVQ